MNLTHDKLALMDTTRLKQLIKHNLKLRLNISTIKQLQKAVFKSWINKGQYYKITDNELIGIINGLTVS